jgi:hypothetical protein
MNQPAPLYTRPLPGGGYVAIEQVDDASSVVESEPSEAARTSYRARLRVERRADPLRREGHLAPVIADVEGVEPQAAFAELHAIAASNVSLAQRIQRWQMRGRPRA